MFNIGDKAPDFSAKDQNNNTIKLSDFLGKKVVLYFYPKDDTPGCTKEACSFRDNFEELEKEGMVILGVSPDESSSHKKFIAKYSLPFNLLADPEKEILMQCLEQAYHVGTKDEPSMFLRWIRESSCSQSALNPGDRDTARCDHLFGVLGEGKLFHGASIRAD